MLLMFFSCFLLLPDSCLITGQLEKAGGLCTVSKEMLEIT